MKQGYIQVYTGNGKGKTTAALGLAVRAAGSGLRVFIGQFLKGQPYSELHSLKRFSKSIVIHQYGKKEFLSKRKLLKNDMKMAKTGFNDVQKAIKSGKFDVVILDEINYAVYFGLIEIADVVNLQKYKPKFVELVLTGRNAPKEILKSADLVTEMKEKKHYFKKGIKARKGIEY